MTPRTHVALVAITAPVLAPDASGVRDRRRSMRGLPFPLGDAGDRWRALLFGAPPSFR